MQRAGELWLPLDRTEADALFTDAGRVRLLNRLCLYGGPALLALAAAAMPPDANFDLANYHYYDAWAFLHGQSASAPSLAGSPGYYNPLLDLPFYWANTHLPGRAVAFLLGLVHGACFVLLYLLTRTVLFAAADMRSVAAAGAIALAGVTAAVSIAELGTTFYDYVGGAGVMLCLYLLAHHALEDEYNLQLATWAGLALGIVSGLKLTNAPYAIGIGLCIPLLARRAWMRRTVLFLAGGIAGVIAAGGYWMAHLWRQFANPLFPYFNNLFQSPYGSLSGDNRDLRFLPHGWYDTLLYPLVVTLHPARTIEVPMRDLRFLALYLAIPAGAALLAATRDQSRSYEENMRRRYLIFLLAALGLTYVAWLLLFSIRRYALALEMLTPLVLTMLVFSWPEARKTVAVIAVAVLVVTTRPSTLGRFSWQGWTGPIVKATLPDGTPDNAMVLVAGWRPKSFLVPFFPQNTTFVPIGVRKNRSPADIAELRHRIDAHHGPILVLIHSMEMKDVAALSAFNIATGECQPIRSTLDLKGPVMLCQAKRAKI